MELNFGNGLAALELLHQMARGDGFGVIVGQGVKYMKAYFAKEFGADPEFLHDIGMEIKKLQPTLPVILIAHNLQAIKLPREDRNLYAIDI